MRARLGLLDTSDVDWACAAKTAEGLSHGEISVACKQAAKNAILAHSTTVRGADLLAALEERRSTHG